MAGNTAKSHLAKIIVFYLCFYLMCAFRCWNTNVCVCSALYFAFMPDLRSCVSYWDHWCYFSMKIKCGLLFVLHFHWTNSFTMSSARSKQISKAIIYLIYFCVLKQTDLKDVFTRSYVCDVHPLTVNVMPVGVPAANWDSLLSHVITGISLVET